MTGGLSANQIRVAWQIGLFEWSVAGFERERIACLSLTVGML